VAAQSTWCSDLLRWPEKLTTKKVLTRYEAILDDPQSAGLERIADQYKAAAASSQRLLQERASLEAQIEPPPRQKRGYER